MIRDARVLRAGPSGARKTCSAKVVTEQLREEIHDVEATYVNCRRNYTVPYLYQALDDLDATSVEMSSDSIRLGSISRYSSYYSSEAVSCEGFETTTLLNQHRTAQSVENIESVSLRLRRLESGRSGGGCGGIPMTCLGELLATRRDR